jgi:hypothetical protein
MIDADLRFEGFDARSWHNLLSLFAPGVTGRAEASPPSAEGTPEPCGAAGRAEGSLLVVVDAEDHPLAALHTLYGRVTLDGPASDPWALCATHGARRCVILREGALEELGERLALRLGPEDDYLAQGVALLQTLRELADGGLVRVWPKRYIQVPIPSAVAIARAMDVLLPDGRAAVLALWEGRRLWTAAALRRRGGRLDWVAGPDLVARWASVEGGPRACAEGINDGIARAMDTPVHVGLFGEAGQVRHLLRQGEPGAWARAVAAGDPLVEPMPAYVAMALGADVLRGVARASTTGLRDRLSQLGEYLRSR